MDEEHQTNWDKWMLHTTHTACERAQNRNPILITQRRRMELCRLFRLKYQHTKIGVRGAGGTNACRMCVYTRQRRGHSTERELYFIKVVQWSLWTVKHAFERVIKHQHCWIPPSADSLEATQFTENAWKERIKRWSLTLKRLMRNRVRSMRSIVWNGTGEMSHMKLTIVYVCTNDTNALDCI